MISYPVRSPVQRPVVSPDNAALIGDILEDFESWTHVGNDFTGKDGQAWTLTTGTDGTWDLVTFGGSQALQIVAPVTLPSASYIIFGSWRLPAFNGYFDLSQYSTLFFDFTITEITSGTVTCTWGTDFFAGAHQSSQALGAQTMEFDITSQDGDIALQINVSDGVTVNFTSIRALA